MVQSRRSRRNPLIRRIQRHAQVSALSGRRSLAAALSTPQDAWNRPGRGPVPVVMASLAPTPVPGEGNEGIFEKEPGGEPTGSEQFQSAEMDPGQSASVLESQEGRSNSSGFQGQQQAGMDSLSSTSQKPAELAVQRQAQSAAASAKPQEERSHEQRGAAKQAETGSLSPQEDGVWKRLQAIFRKHEEKRREAEETDEPSLDRSAAREEDLERPEEGSEDKNELQSPRLPAGLPGQAVAMSAGAPVREPSSTPGTPEQGNGQTPDEAETPGEITGVSQLAGQGASKDQPALSEPGTTGDIPSVAQMQNTEKESALNIPNEAGPSKKLVTTIAESEEDRAARTEVPTPQVSIPKREPAGRDAEKNSSSESAASNVILRQPGEQPPAVLREIPQEVPRTENRVPQVVQPLPLEEVWPVQRQASQPELPEMGDGYPSATLRTGIGAEGNIEDDASIGAGEPIGTMHIPGASREILDQEEHVQVREALREVSPGKPTDSSVELITPRRRRPTREPEVVIDTSEKVTLGEPDQSLSEKVIPSLSSETDRTVLEAGRRAPGKDFESSSERVFGESEQIETEIGPLPVDLWKLIGERPHAAQPQPLHASAPANSGKPVQGGAPTLQTSKTGPAVPSRFVQRQAAESTTSGDQSAAVGPLSMRVPGTSGEAEPQRGQPQAEMDMDELARRVYGEVKKRLALEWERMRRRV